MPTCELCGADTGSDHKSGYVHGVEMILCQNCYKKHAKPGSDSSNKGSKSSKSKSKGRSKSSSKGSSKSSRGRKSSKSSSKGSSSKKKGSLTDQDIVMDYGGIVREGRVNKDMSQEDLGKKINEKSSVIHRIESEHMEPSISLAKKLERELDIQLLGDQSIDYEKGDRDSNGDEVTLGDVADIKKS